MLFLVLLEAGDLKLLFKGNSLYEYQTLYFVRKSGKNGQDTFEARLKVRIPNRFFGFV